MSYIDIHNVYKSFSNDKKKVVLKNFELKINKGDFVVLFGPNGCGKTTLLNILAGIIDVDKGKVTINGYHPNKEKIGYVFQNYRDSLLPWKTNIENIAFPLELKGVNYKDRIYNASILFDTPNVIAGIIIIGLIGLFTNGFILAVEKKIVHWHGI